MFSCNFLKFRYFFFLFFITIGRAWGQAGAWTPQVPARNVRSKSVKTTEKPRETRARENSNLILPAGYDGPAGS